MKIPKMKNPIPNILVFATLLFSPSAVACTSAIVAASANPYGRPMLWKHRDTSAIDNKIEYIPSKEGSFAYVALFNADDRNCSQAWTGMNEAGFAVMNTASYNLKDDNVAASKMDREGYLMTAALRSCRTVDDFDALLRKMPKPLGVEANFGVIDAEGNGAYFETNNHSFTRFDLGDAPDGLLIRSNYSHSGRKGEGLGHTREANAEHILRPYAREGLVSADVLTEVASRSFYRDISGKDYSKGDERIIPDVDFIPRYKSTATIVIEGMVPAENAADVSPKEVASQYVMWTGLGYPPCADIFGVWCSPEGVDSSLRGIGAKGHSPQGDLVKSRRDDVFGSSPDSNIPYVDLGKLFNRSGTGYAQITGKGNKAVYEKIRRTRDGKPLQPK